MWMFVRFVTCLSHGNFHEHVDIYSVISQICIYYANNIIKMYQH